MALLASVGLPLWFHHAASQSQTTDDHVNILIESKLNPAIKGIADQLTSLNEQVGELKGRFNQLDSEQKKATKLQLNKLSAQIAASLSSKTNMNPEIVVRLGEDVLPFVKSSTPKYRKPHGA